MSAYSRCHLKLAGIVYGLNYGYAIAPLHFLSRVSAKKIRIHQPLGLVNPWVCGLSLSHF
ncbi:MAG: hypothetical protein AAF282_03645 [Cyanobacteria bacterium P01_A01_bin.15]